MVSPVYKGGFGVGGFSRFPVWAAAPDGESVIFYSNGVFAGNETGGGSEYLARRGASGWSTASVGVPAGFPLGGGLFAAAAGNPDVSPNLESILVRTFAGTNTVEAEVGDTSTTQGFVLHQTAHADTADGWEIAGPLVHEEPTRQIAIEPRGASADFCHIVLESRSSLLPEAPETAAEEAYELDRGCNGGPGSLRLVGLDDESPGRLIDPACANAEVGDQVFTVSPSRYNAISADGSEVFFTDCLGPGVSSGAPDVPHQLFLRLGEAHSVEVSKPTSESDGCAEVSSCEVDAARPSADFAGASADGTRVYFTTAAELTPGDTDASTNLFMARIGCPGGGSDCAASARRVVSLARVSAGAHGGGAAEVQGVVRISPDGSRVYFVARGALTETANAQGASPVSGAENLYVYDTASGETALVGRLNAADSGLWGHNEVSEGFGAAAQTAGADGRFLVFATVAPLVADDANTARDVYRYDDVTGALTRVSHGQDGFDANGNAARSSATIQPGFFGGQVRFQYELNTRAITEDGSRIVFTTSSPLSPEATNGQSNVYEWHEQTPGGEGSVSLISTGKGEGAAGDPMITPSGRDIFFSTTQGLVSQDTDGLADLYDARLGGGFPAEPAAPQPCEGDACQGPLTNPAPLLVPGSVSQAPGEDLAPPPATVLTKPDPKRLAKCKRGYIRGRHGHCVKVKKKARKATPGHSNMGGRS